MFFRKVDLGLVGSLHISMVEACGWLSYHLRGLWLEDNSYQVVDDLRPLSRALRAIQSILYSFQGFSAYLLRLSSQPCCSVIT